MPISRDARADRRRRLLRETGDEAAANQPHGKRVSRRGQAEESAETNVKRKAGYSQDVRRACGQRLVNLIPVRKRYFAGAVLLSLLVPSILLVAHHMVFVSGWLRWWGHPLATALDIGHPRGIAAWFCSQLWLLCLAATVLTFQLRRHKLDDYNGEYRLWSWLVVTCLIGSVDATTSICDLFAEALDRWTQMNLGWSGSAIVDATLAVLIGMLGLRLCGELKSVPLSLLFWLVGLVAWAGSAALGRAEFLLEISAPVRYWLHAGLWLGGLTSIWLAALTYLRSVYIDAQQRFLLRGRLAAGNGSALGQRLRNIVPCMPSLPAFMRKKNSEVALPNVAPKRSRARRNQSEEDRDQAEDSAGSQPVGSARQAPNPASTTRDPGRENREADSPAQRRSRFNGWFRRPKDTDEADEYRKVGAENRSSAGKSIEPIAAQQSRSNSPSNGSSDQQNAEPESQRRGWLTKRPKTNNPATTSRRSSQSEVSAKAKSESRGWWSLFRMIRLKLPSLRLPPPGQTSSGAAVTQREIQPVSQDRNLPGTGPSTASRPPSQPSTSPPSQRSNAQLSGEDGDDGRQMSKAERKRLRRQQQSRVA